MNIRVVQVGLGPIGAAIAAQVVARRGFQLAGAVDVDPALAGRDVGELLGGGRRLRVKITTDIARTIRAVRPDVAVLSTSSWLVDALPHIEQAVACRVPVVTTTEEAAYPTPRTRRLARRLDEAARRARVAVLGTGVNPGFLMDALPIALTAACERVDRIEVRRVQDARIRRLPFQKKIGAGLTPAEFQRQVDRGRVRHVGFPESIRMIADAMGWRLDRITDEVFPRMADRAVGSEHLHVAAGEVAGIVQEGTGYVAGEPRIVLRLEAFLGAPESYDAVLIDGVPRISSRIEGGVHGDIATASVVVNAIPAVIVAAPGLRTMRDMRLPSWFGGR
jgi:4-hydroxy-tetrahydrodipicolinate reductase